MDTQPIRILVVEDEPQYRFLLKLNLEASGYTVTLVENGRTGLEQVIAHEPDLVLLDIMLPDVDGMVLCRHLRQFSTVPIVMITARAEQKDVIAGLNAGADDYVTKPFGVEELLARIRANLRRRAIDQAPPVLAIVGVGDLAIDRTRQRVFRGAEEILLTDIEFRLLDELVQRLGHVVRAGHLLDVVWGPGYEEATKVLHQSIYRLRHKIEQDPTHPHYLLNRAGQGYILVDPARNR